MVTGSQWRFKLSHSPAWSVICFVFALLPWLVKALLCQLVVQTLLIFILLLTYSNVCDWPRDSQFSLVCQREMLPVLHGGTRKGRILGTSFAILLETKTWSLCTCPAEQTLISACFPSKTVPYCCHLSSTTPPLLLPVLLAQLQPGGGTTVQQALLSTP